MSTEKSRQKLLGDATVGELAEAIAGELITQLNKNMEKLDKELSEAESKNFSDYKTLEEWYGDSKPEFKRLIAIVRYLAKI